MRRPAVLVLAACLPLAGARRRELDQHTRAKPLRLADATMIVEVNATDGDAGLQVFLDGEPWNTMRDHGPERAQDPQRRHQEPAEGYGLTSCSPRAASRRSSASR